MDELFHFATVCDVGFYRVFVFGAGCNSLPAVIVRERKQMWCNSTTDSIVWMGEDGKRWSGRLNSKIHQVFLAIRVCNEIDFPLL